MSVFSSDVVVDNTVLVDGSAVTQPISGAVSVSNFPATQPVSGTVTVQQPTGSNLHVAVDGTVNVLTAVATTAVITTVTQPNTTDTLLLAANANRKSAIIFLPKSGTSIAFDSSASATHFTYKTGATNTIITVTGYTGVIHSFGAADTINVTELA